MSEPVVGIDEAGKGPVLGSMFAAAVFVPSTDRLPEGIRDSKVLTPDRREELAGLLRDDQEIELAVVEVPPDRIDNPATDMNTLTVEAHADALRQINTDEVSVIVDAGDVNAARFGNRIRTRVDGAFDILAEHGADTSYAVVGAASIIAKVERDTHIARLAEEYGEIGSGYPHDHATQQFLRSFVEETGSLPACARRSWRTSQTVLAEANQHALSDF